MYDNMIKSESKESKENIDNNCAVHYVMAMYEP